MGPFGGPSGAAAGGFAAAVHPPAPSPPAGGEGSGRGLLGCRGRLLLLLPSLLLALHLALHHRHLGPPPAHPPPRGQGRGRGWPCCAVGQPAHTLRGWVLGARPAATMGLRAPCVQGLGRAEDARMLICAHACTRACVLVRTHACARVYVCAHACTPLAVRSTSKHAPEQAARVCALAACLHALHASSEACPHLLWPSPAGQLVRPINPGGFCSVPRVQFV